MEILIKNLKWANVFVLVAWQSKVLLVEIRKSLKVRFDVNDIGPLNHQQNTKGILPGSFSGEGQGIVAQGVLKEPTLLEATEVLAKHDENYVPPELGEKMQKVHKPMGAELKGESEADRRYKETQQKSQEGR